MRDLLPEVRRSLLSDNAPDPLLALVSIHRPGHESKYLVDNTEPVEKDGIVYQPFPIAATLPDDADRGQVTAQLTIVNIDQEIERAIDEYDGIPTVDIEIVLATDTAVLHTAAYGFSLLDASTSLESISGQLGFGTQIFMQPANKDRTTPSNSPGLYP
jgi:hypothetical protein